MKLICPRCQKSYSDDDLFCPECGNALVDENERETVVNPNPFYAGNPGGGGGGHYDPTVNIPSGGGGFTPQPPPSPVPRPNAGNNNVLFAIIGGCVVIIGVLIYFLAAGGPSKPQYETVSGTNKTPSPSPTPSPTPSVDNRPAVNSAPVNAPPPEPPPQRTSYLPERFERTYRGTSYVNGGLPLTLTLARDGSALKGSAVTPGDEDGLSGSISPDGSFALEGYNYKAGRVTGNWRGTISESGEVSGTWIATSNGRRVRFYAK